MAQPYVLVQGAERPSLALTLTEDGTLVDLSTSTWSVKVGAPGSAALVTKTSGVTGASTAPNCTVAWSAGELAAVGTGSYTLQVESTVSGVQRMWQLPLQIIPAIT